MPKAHAPITTPISDRVLAGLFSDQCVARPSASSTILLMFKAKLAQDWLGGG